mmetsp:Transcript_9471/g.29487  ORF Transcript_9471/g.29487 Transcript_9471/m.29487 type:complete len:172 (-) Transcript_9471:71-586(-)
MLPHRPLWLIVALAPGFRAFVLQLRSAAPRATATNGDASVARRAAADDAWSWHPPEEWHAYGCTDDCVVPDAADAAEEAVEICSVDSDAPSDCVDVYDVQRRGGFDYAPLPGDNGSDVDVAMIFGEHDDFVVPATPPRRLRIREKIRSDAAPAPRGRQPSLTPRVGRVASF